MENLKNLPEDIVSQIKLHRGRPKGKASSNNTKKLLELFNIKKQLSINELLVGMMRKYNIKVTRFWISCTIFRMRKNKELKSVKGKVGIYEVIKN